MNQNLTPLRLGSAAIAAVLALSSTPTFAQSTDATTPTAPAGTAPVTITPPAARPTPPTAAPTETPPTPAANTPMTISAPTSADAPVSVNPITELPSAASSNANGTISAVSADAVEQAPSTHRGTTSHSKAVSSSKAVTQSAAAPKVTEPLPAAPLAAAPAPAPVPAPASQSVAKAPPAQRVDDDTLALAGAGGFGIILLAGGAVALSRRKRRNEGEVVASEFGEPEAEPVVVTRSPLAPVAPTPMAPAMAAKANALPNGFDLSRFGPHMQAAYRGPTADNPSLSLKRRLKRAAFFDRKERLAAESAMTPAPLPVAATGTIATNAAAPQHDGQMVYRPQKLSKGGFRPAFRTSPR